jgi:hypothetical protein
MVDIDLVQEELRELARPVVEAAGHPSEPFGVYLFRADTPQARLARYVEDTVFAEWFGNSSELIDAEYGPYDESTYFITVIDHLRHLPAGMIRVTIPSERGLKTLADIEAVWKQPLDETVARTGLEWDRSVVWDVATMAVHADYRGKATDGMISLAMYQAVVRSFRSGGARWFVCVLDLHVANLMQDLTSQPFWTFDGVEPINYLDSPASNAFWCDFEEYGPRLRSADPFMYGVLFDGVGIESVVREASYDVAAEMAGRTAPALRLVDHDATRAPA